MLLVNGKLLQYGTSGMMNKCRHNTKSYTIKKVSHSIGLYYSALTHRLGLRPLDEEYIMMGMAGWGNQNTNQLLKEH